MSIKCVVTGENLAIQKLCQELHKSINNYNERVIEELPQTAEQCKNCSAVFTFLDNYVNWKVFEKFVGLEVRIEYEDGNWFKKKRHKYGAYIRNQKVSSSNRIEECTSFEHSNSERGVENFTVEDNEKLDDFEDLDLWEIRNGYRTE